MKHELEKRLKQYLIDLDDECFCEYDDVEIVNTWINREKLEKFIPKFLFKLPCPFCGKINDQVISPEIEFFRKTLSYSG